MQFKSIIVFAALLFVAQYSLANPLPSASEGEHTEHEEPLEKCEDDTCRQLNTDNYFYKHWACEFTKTFLEWAKTFTEKCAEVLKELEGHEDASKYEKAKKELEHVIHLYEEAVKEEDKHKKFHLAYKLHKLLVTYLNHFDKPENKDDPILELLKKHDVQESIDEGHKHFEKLHNEFEAAFQKYLEELSENQKEAHAKIVEWHDKLKAKESVDDKCEEFGQFFVYFNHDLEKDHEHHEEAEHHEEGEHHE